MKNNNELGNSIFILDGITTIIAIFGAIWIRYLLPGIEIINITSHIFLIPLLFFLVSSYLTYFNGYRGPYNMTHIGYLIAVSKTMLATLATLLILLFFLRIEYISRLVILLFVLIEFFVLLGIRIYVAQNHKHQIKNGKKKLKVLIIGTRSRAKLLVKALQQHIPYGIEIVGFLDPNPEHLGEIILDHPVIGTIDNVSEVLKNNVVDEVIIAISRSLLTDAEPIVLACEEEGIRLRFMADVFNVHVARVSLSQVRGIPLLSMEPVAQDDQQLLAKRMFDLTLTTLAIPFLVPIFATIAMAIKFDSPGPVFFVQQRVGLRKNKFPMFKFRSMHINAEEKLKEIEHLNEAEGPIFKMTNDPRVTTVGNFLRKTSLDELPQLINVLRGEMSLVGPRPMSTRDVDLFDRGIQRKRFSVQPGLTCLWQISGRSNLPFEKWLELDLEYIENWSFWTDIKILFKTIPAVLGSKGAM